MNLVEKPFLLNIAKRHTYEIYVRTFKRYLLAHDHTTFPQNERWTPEADLMETELGLPRSYCQ